MGRHPVLFFEPFLHGVRCSPRRIRHVSTRFRTDDPQHPAALTPAAVPKENFMRLIMKSTATFFLLAILLLTASAAAETPRTKPGDVGISAERLQRIHELI